MKVACNLESGVIALLLCGAAALALAQEDLTQPPRLDESSDATSLPAAGKAPSEGSPGEARLAAEPDDRADSLEEVVVVGPKPWRMPELPDLGTTWREQHEKEEKNGRIQVSFLPLYDPERPTTGADIFLANREIQRVGFIRVFELRFGSRSR